MTNARAPRRLRGQINGHGSDTSQIAHRADDLLSSADFIGAADFASRLKTWRRLNGIKQAVLAEMLGVSQSAVSFWENGRDLPTAEKMQRINGLIAQSRRDEVMIERLFVERQDGVRALFDFDGIEMIAASRGFHALWPDTAKLTSRFFADQLVNEARKMVFDSSYRDAILKGELAIASGISDRMTAHQLDAVVPHRWHMCFRRYGARIIVDVVYEPCDPSLRSGITDLVFLDNLIKS